jgi:putative tricarboxylic transport membrane protein
VKRYEVNSAGPVQARGKASWPGLLPIVLPAVLVALALILPSWMFQSDQSASKIGLGPAAWPTAMLWALAFFASCWGAVNLRDYRATGGHARFAVPDDEEAYSIGKALIGLAMILAYGALLPVVGFALATVCFIALWCVVGGLRKPLVLVPVSVLGTIALLWMFMGAALMPLPRGAGAFGEFSIWVLRTLAIY